jgi:integrase
MYFPGRIRRSTAAQISAISFRDAVPEFLGWAVSEYRKHPNSYKRIKTSLSSALVFFDKLPVMALDGAKLDDYKTWRTQEHEVEDVTLRHDLHGLSVFFAYAVRHHWTLNNPVHDVSIPSDADAIRIHVITWAEQEEYFRLANLNCNLSDVTRLILNQGIRPDEVVALCKSDVDLENGTIFISSGKTPAARRLLHMTKETREIVKRRMAEDSPWLFPSPHKPGAHIVRVNSAHDRLVEAAAKEGVVIAFVPYDFRHTFATIAAQSGIDISTLAALLGHESTRCVHKYVHPTAEHKKAAMELYDRKRIQDRKVFEACTAE